MSALLERLFALILSELQAEWTLQAPLPILAASNGTPLPEDFACVTVTDPEAPEEGLCGITHTVTLSTCVPIERREEAERLASALLTLDLGDIQWAATSRYSQLRPGHLYAWEPGLSETDLTDGDRLTLTASARLTCARLAPQ